MLCMHDTCCRCKRIAGHVSMLADALAATHPDIVVGRVNCEREEYFCAHVIKISHTPSFKVGAEHPPLLGGGTLLHCSVWWPLCCPTLGVGPAWRAAKGDRPGLSSQGLT